MAKTKIVYRGSFPPPRIEHGRTVRGLGKVVGRTRNSDGWMYRCHKDGLPCDLYWFESDEQAMRKSK